MSRPTTWLFRENDCTALDYNSSIPAVFGEFRRPGVPSGRNDLTTPRYPFPIRDTLIIGGADRRGPFAKAY